MEGRMPFSPIFTARRDEIQKFTLAKLSNNNSNHRLKIPNTRVSLTKSDTSRE